MLKHSSGMLMSFGYDFINKRAEPRMVFWSDVDGKTWECRRDNTAGAMRLPCKVEPLFVKEIGDTVIAYQPGTCIEMKRIGPDFVWAFWVLQSEPHASVPFNFATHTSTDSDGRHQNSISDYQGLRS